jgi:hypothetical protein
LVLNKYLLLFYFLFFAYCFVVGKPEGKIPLERSRRRWEDGLKMDLREIGWGGGLIWLSIGIVGGLL